MFCVLQFNIREKRDWVCVCVCENEIRQNEPFRKDFWRDFIQRKWVRASNNQTQWIWATVRSHSTIKLRARQKIKQDQQQPNVYGCECLCADMREMFFCNSIEFTCTCNRQSVKHTEKNAHTFCFSLAIENRFHRHCVVLLVCAHVPF